MQSINEIPGGWPQDNEPIDDTIQPVNLFDQMEAERREQAVLLNQGMTFTTPVRSLLRFFSKKRERTWLLKQPYLGTLDYLAAEFIDLDFNEVFIKENPLPEARRLQMHNAKRCARIVAIALLNSSQGIRLGTWLLSRYLLWHITPSILLQLVILIQRMSNLGDFTSSIRLMSVAKRTTAPALMENPEEAARLA